MTRKNYVVALAFEPRPEDGVLSCCPGPHAHDVTCLSRDPERVVLMEKRRPVWMRDLLNGPGGAVEDGESDEAALVREFREETGAETDPSDWQVRLVLVSSWVRVAVGVTFREVSVRTTTDEPVYWCEVHPDAGLVRRWVSNLRWIVPLVLDRNMAWPLVLAFREVPG